MEYSTIHTRKNKGGRTYYYQTITADTDTANDVVIWKGRVSKATYLETLSVAVATDRVVHQDDVMLITKN